MKLLVFRSRIWLNFGEVDCVLMPNVVNWLARWLASGCHLLVFRRRITDNFGEVDCLVPNLVNWLTRWPARMWSAGWLAGWLPAGTCFHFATELTSSFVKLTVF